MTSRLFVGALGVAACGAGQHHGPSRVACRDDQLVELGLQEDVIAFASCERAGGLRIRTGAPLDLSVLSLREVRGDVVIGPTVAVDTVAINSLVEVGGTIRIASNGSLRGIYLPMLESAGSLQVENNPVVMTISVPKLTTVGSVVVVGNNALETVIATSLTGTPNERRIEGNPHLSSDVLEAPAAGTALP